MRVRLLPAGDTALLVEIADLAGSDSGDGVLALIEALQAADLPGVQEMVPAARTVFVQAATGADLGELGGAIANIAVRTATVSVARAVTGEVLIPVLYDGPDFDDVCRLTGLRRAEVIARHTGNLWRAAFIGFAPGFAYLTGGDHGLTVARRDESRTVVPAGSVALAGEYTAVYPSASPGGWQLIGQTEVSTWDVERDPPSLIRPGDLVRFVDIERAEQ